jgi:hypothetical protein
VNEKTKENGNGSDTSKEFMEPTSVTNYDKVRVHGKSDMGT